MSDNIIDGDDQTAALIIQGIIGSGWCCCPATWSADDVTAAIKRGDCGEYIPGTPWAVVETSSELETLVSPGECTACNPPGSRRHWLLLGGATGFVVRPEELTIISVNGRTDWQNMTFGELFR